MPIYVLEGEPTAIGSLFSGIGTVVTNILNIFGTVCTTLMSNPLFQITLGIVILMILIGMVFYLVKKIKRRG